MKNEDLEQKLIDNILKFGLDDFLHLLSDGKSLKPIIHEIVNGKKYA